MSESLSGNQNAEQNEPEIIEVVIDGKVFKKTILPPATAKVILNSKGGVKRLPAQSRPLTKEEEDKLEDFNRDARTIYQRGFSDSGRTSDGAPQGDVALDGGSRINGAYTPDDYYLTRDERQEHQE